MRFRAAAVVSTAAVCAALAGCSSASSAQEYDLPKGEAEQFGSAYMSKVVAGPEGEDLAKGAGEYVVISNNVGIRTDMGGWYVEDADGNRLPLGVGTQVEKDGHLRLYTSCGKNTDDKIFACADEEVFDDAGETLTLRDAADAEVAKFAYGDASE